MRRILLVEDNADLLEMLASLLAAAGYDVAAAATPDAAASILAKGGVDLVLADLMLEPKRIDTCWETLDRLLDLAHPAPVGLLTAWPVAEADAQRRNLAFVLAKPCSRGQLFDQLAKTLDLPELDVMHETRLRRYFGCIERGAYDELGRLCTEDVVYRLPGPDPRFANEVRGRSAFVSFTAQTFAAFQEPQFELGSMRTLPRGALVEYVGSWRDVEDRRRMPGAVMFELRGELIKRIHVRVNTDELR